MDKKSSRKNKVELLPPEIKEQLNELIRAGNLTQQEILDRLAQLIDEKGRRCRAEPQWIQPLSQENGGSWGENHGRAADR